MVGKPIWNFEKDDLKYKIFFLGFGYIAKYSNPETKKIFLYFKLSFSKFTIYFLTNPTKTPTQILKKLKTQN